MSLSDILDVSSLLVLIVGVVLALIQLRKITSSLRVGQQTNLVSVIAHCASRFEKIISDDTGDDEVKVGSWWYRLFDLYSEEFNFFRKGLLDPDIFEIWMNELATGYQESPRVGLSQRARKHEQYLKVTLPSYYALHDFFRRLEGISRTADPEVRAREVHKLIIEFAHKDSEFEISRST